MAPKGGKGGGGSGGGSRGGSSSCPNCTNPLQLIGSDWENALVTAFFAINVIVAFVLLCCIFLQTRFKWLRDHDLSLDKLRNKYTTGAACLLISYILSIVDLALREEAVQTIYLYYITYIFISGFWRIADIIIIAIIYRTIAESSLSNLARKLSILHKILVGILAVLSIAAFGLYTAQTVDLIRGSVYENISVDKGFAYTSLAYNSLYLLAALLAGLESLTVMFRARSKGTLIMLTVVTPALILHSLFYLINIAVVTYFTRSSRRRLTSGQNTIRWVCAFVTETTNVFIWGGVVLIGWLAFRKGASRAGKYVSGTAN